MAQRERIDRVVTALDEHGIDALLVTGLVNVRYLTGFSGTNGQVLIRRNGATFLSDPRYEARAGDLVQGADIVIYPDRLTDVLPGLLDGVARLGFEAGSVTVASRDRLAEALEGIELVATDGIVEDMRRVKDPAELEAIKAAVALTDDAFSWIVQRLAPGMTERQVALDLEVHMRSAGADGVAFEPIVGSGPLSAHIHHSPSDRSFDKGDLVLLDFGCRVGGYCSDLTRTVVLGSATDEQRALYDLVARMQAAGIDALRAGASGVEVDAAARSLAEEAGHAERFGHGLGHGVGLDVHEAPRLARTSEDTLRAGEVVTVEPGVYLPGSGGIRIEDCVLVADEGAEVLSAAPKADLIEL